MSDPQQRPLHGAAIYNPHLHCKEELINLFVARRQLLDHLVTDLRCTASAASPQHHLVIGQRGMGKTMLLRRLAFAIEDDPDLSRSFLALTFPEEQYNVGRLSDFWLNCTDALGDLLERTGRSKEAAELDEMADDIRTADEEQRARAALALLARTAKSLKRRLVLLIDNIDLVLARIDEQEWALREALSADSQLVLIGASFEAVESSYQYGRAFYDFFRVHDLEGLDLEETRELIIHHADSWNLPEVKRLALDDPARIRVLHTLTGGNPRTVVLLFNVLALGVEGDVRTDLERLLDQTTPLYKARFEALPPQAQQVVHAIAMHWDPTSAGELAEILMMDVNAVSSQLNRLVKQAIVEKVQYEPESKTGFQIAERFFNIWYLMRASRRVRRRLLWLVDFLKTFYSQDQLQARALAHIEHGLSLDPSRRLRHVEYGFALAGAIADQAWRRSLEDTGVHALLRDESLRSQLVELIDVESGDPERKDAIEQLQKFERARHQTVSSHPEVPGWPGEEFWQRLSQSLELPLGVKVILAENLSSPGQVASVTSWLESGRDRQDRRYACAVTVAALEKAVSAGLMIDAFDEEGATRAESVLKTLGLRAVAIANAISFSDQYGGKVDGGAAALLASELEKSSSPWPGLVWLRVSRKLKRPPSEARIRKVITHVAALGSCHELITGSLGEVLCQLERFEDAERTYRNFLVDHEACERIWFALGTLLGDQLNREEEAEAAFRKCLELNPRSAPAWRGIGLIAASKETTESYKEAERAFTSALEAEPTDAVAWLGLGASLFRFGRYDEAETACRKALELEEYSAQWMGLACTLELLGRMEEAEEAYRRAIQGYQEERDRNNEDVDSEFELAIRSRFAWFLLLKRSDYEGSEVIAREIPPSEADYHGILATTLAHKGSWKAAAGHAKTFIAATLEADIEGEWPRTLAFFREAVQAGRAREALEILERTGAAERWRPLREALEAAARGKESYLRRVAPEVRQPAREILDQLMAKAPALEKESAAQWVAEPPAEFKRPRAGGSAPSKVRRAVKRK